MKPPRTRKREGNLIIMKREDLESLAKIHCTLPETAAFYECSIEKVISRVREMYGLSWKEFAERYAGQGKVSLRRLGWRKALAGDWDALKFHLKNYCDMVDKVDNTHSGADGGAIQVIAQSILQNPTTPEEAASAYRELVRSRSDS